MQKILLTLLMIVGFLLAISESPDTFTPNILGLIILIATSWKLRLFNTNHS